MLTLSAFRARYPEFKTAADTFVQSILDEAELRIDRGVFGTRGDIAQGLMAAHLLLNAPYGRSQRLEGGEALDDRYMQEFDLLTIECTPKMLVL